MTCDVCPYSLQCFGGRLQRFQCRTCGRVIIEQYIGEQPTGEFRYSLIRCPSPQYEEAGVVTRGCPICIDDVMWQNVPVEDLSDL
jgi:hypothetical protein